MAGMNSTVLTCLLSLALATPFAGATMPMTLDSPAIGRSNVRQVVGLAGLGLIDKEWGGTPRQSIFQVIPSTSVLHQACHVFDSEAALVIPSKRLLQEIHPLSFRVVFESINPFARETQHHADPLVCSCCRSRTRRRGLRFGTHCASERRLHCLAPSVWLPRPRRWTLIPILCFLDSPLRSGFCNRAARPQISSEPSILPMFTPGAAFPAQARFVVGFGLRH